MDYMNKLTIQTANSYGLDRTFLIPINMVQGFKRVSS